ncbi:MAG: hypothetical protein ACR5KV_05100 [Wolbachia sp.]
MKIGGVCSVITGFTTVGGCVATTQLPMLAITGIALPAALVARPVAGGITYAILKPSNKLEKINVKQEREGIELKSIY